MRRVLRFNPNDPSQDELTRTIFMGKFNTHGLTEFFYELQSGPTLPVGIGIAFEIEENSARVLFETLNQQMYHPRPDVIIIPVKIKNWGGEDKEFVRWIQEKWITKYPRE